MNAIAYVTTSKGRLHHIQQTLPHIVSQNPDEIVVVDYSCPQKTGDWVEANYPQVKVVRVDDDAGFCLPRARNLGAKNTTSPWVCFIDADVMIEPGFTDWMRANLKPKNFYRAAPKDGTRDLETWGTVICPRHEFAFIGGYDEAFRGWGGEDDDLYFSLKLVGLAEKEYPSSYVTAIPHDDAERVTFHRVKSKKLQQIINRFYNKAKQITMVMQGRAKPMSLAERQSLMDHIANKVVAWDGNPSNPEPAFTIQFANDGWLPKPYSMRLQFSVTLSLRDIGEKHTVSGE